MANKGFKCLPPFFLTGHVCQLRTQVQERNRNWTFLQHWAIQSHVWWVYGCFLSHCKHPSKLQTVMCLVGGIIDNFTCKKPQDLNIDQRLHLCNARFPALKTSNWKYELFTVVYKTKQSLFRADLLQITPIENNGTHGSMNHVLREPYFIPAHPDERSGPTSCPLISLNLTDSLGCTCDALVGIITIKLPSK